MAIDLSIVIPTFKRPTLLFRCLNALYQQDFPPDRYEIIVVTDGPDPETLDITAGAIGDGPCLHVCSTVVKKGPAAARNVGWHGASGQLIIFTDDDCIPDQHWVSSYWQAYKNFQTPFPGQRIGAAFRGPISVPHPARPTDHEKNTAELERADFVTANCACTRYVLEKIEGFDESFATAWREDSDLEFKMLVQDIPILYVPAALVTHPVRRSGWGISLKEQKKSMYNVLLYKKHPDLFREKIYRAPFLNYYAIVVLALTAIVAAFRGAPLVAEIAAAGWALLTAAFVIKRLSNASLSFPHITEMIVTSIFIPFLSLFWTWYGMFRFKTFFL
jgi:glycosyltransferase involved in cell wall biosynthesis